MAVGRVLAWMIVGIVGMLAVGACGSTSATTRDRGGEEASDPSDAAKAARGLVQEIYADLRRGDVDGLQSVVAPDVFVVGPGGKDVFVERSDAIVALNGVLRSGDRHKLSSHALKVTSSPSGHAAWASDTLEIDGLPCVLTAVLAESDGLWTVLVVHVGRPPVGARTPATRAALPGGVAAGARDVVKLYRAAVAAPEHFVEQLADSANLLVLGSGAREVTRGVKAVRKLWKKRLAARPQMAVDGEPRAGVTPDGSLAWIFANVSVAAAGGEPEPYRSLVVYQREGKDWKLIATHDSLAFGGK